MKGFVPILMAVCVLPLCAAPGTSLEVDKTIRQLGDEKFKKRTAAQEQLLEWGRENIEEGIERFFRVYRGHDDPEVRARSREILKELVGVKASEHGEGYIGIMMREEPVPNPDGGIRRAVRITAVMEDTPAQKARLRVGDLVMGIDDRDLSEEGCMNAFGAYVRSKNPGDKVTLHLTRAKRPEEVVVELMRRPNLPANNLQLFGGEMRMPSVEEQKEKEFRDWLRNRLREEENRGK